MNESGDSKKEWKDGIGGGEEAQVPRGIMGEKVRIGCMMGGVMASGEDGTSGTENGSSGTENGGSVWDVRI